MAYNPAVTVSMGVLGEWASHSPDNKRHNSSDDTWSPRDAVLDTNTEQSQSHSAGSARYHKASGQLFAPDGTSVSYSPLRLLIMQPTALCNIDCRYCYLPNRANPKRMGHDTFVAVYNDLMTAPFVGERFTTVWHAGEPLIVGMDFYKQAIQASRRLLSAGRTVTHSLQTNGTLITDEWCELFQSASIRVGVSLDGPADLHDSRRVTRTGRGTHDLVMRGIESLRRNNVPFHAICVLTRASLDRPDEIFDFFASHGIQRLALNMEEIEGANVASSMNATDADSALRRFLDRLHLLAEREGMSVREFESFRRRIRRESTGGPNAQSLPFGVLSVDVAGNYSTFSPELLSMTHPRYGQFTFGNVHTGGFLAMLDNPAFRRVWSDVDSGWRRCRSSCQYFDLCGGGAPSNKVFERGTFDTTETLYCRLAKKAVIDVVLCAMEREVGV